MELTKTKLKEIIKDVMIENYGPQSVSPWTGNYEEYAEAASEAQNIYSQGTAQEFIEHFETISPEKHAGIYHYLKKAGGMDPMKGIKPGDPGYVDWRERSLKDPDAVNLAIIIRRMMDKEAHEMRRKMTEPPHPQRTKTGKQYKSHEEYFRSEIAPDFAGGEESELMRKHFGPSEIDESSKTTL